MDENNFPNIFDEPENSNHQNPYRDKYLEKSNTDFILFGVCGGIAKYVNVDPALIRLIAILALLLGGWIIAAYLITAFLLPEGHSTKELSPEEIENQKKIHFRTVTGSILIFLGIHFAFNAFGLDAGNIFFIYSDSFVIPLILFTCGAYLIGKNALPTFHYSPEKEKRLFRSKEDKLLFGVCGGFAKYINAESTTIRIVLTLGTLLTLGLLGLAYLVLFLGLKMEDHIDEQ